MAAVDPYGHIDDPEERAFQRLFGPWRPLTVPQLAALLDGWDAPWWICGGYAVDAFTGVTRPHEDIDVAFFVSDLDSLRHHLAGRYHLWSVGDQTLRPIDEHHPTLHPRSRQVWLRKHALAP